MKGSPSRCLMPVTEARTWPGMAALIWLRSRLSSLPALSKSTLRLCKLGVSDRRMPCTKAVAAIMISTTMVQPPTVATRRKGARPRLRTA